MANLATDKLRSMAIAAAALLVAFSIAGCPAKKPKTPGCEGDKDCTAPMTCVQHACVECSQNSDCSGGKVCTANACVAKADCETNAQCTGGKYCEAGTCKSCSQDAQCGVGAKCNAGSCEHGKTCSDDMDCAEDEDCVGGTCQKPVSAGSKVAASCPLLTIYFSYDDAGVQENQRNNLDGDAACIEKSIGKNVYVEGHTDSAGTDEYNIALSERRAQTIADYLARLGVDPARMQVVPKGETAPTGQGADKDRRVELLWR